jgi:2-polyprenyl-3-methyl-5-hydroxy-6-metoxy-1,4-benzoquinol methylase
MILEKRKHCPICQSDKSRLFKKGTFDPESLNTDHFKITDSNYGSLWTFFKCDNCGFVFSNPYIPEREILNFYSELEDHEYSSEADGRAKNFEQIIKRLNTLQTPGKTLLDIGAASGIFLNLAKENGYQATGIEPSDYLVKEAHRLYGLDIIKGTIDDLSPGNTYSIITLLDIIEHLVEPDEFFQKLDPFIEKNGIVVIVTPDIKSITSRLTGKHWWHYRIAHVNFFNSTSILQLLKKHKYEVVMKKRYAWNFSLFYLVTRFFPSIKENNTLQKLLKSINLKLQLFDSWEIYAKKI